MNKIDLPDVSAITDTLTLVQVFDKVMQEHGLSVPDDDYSFLAFVEVSPNPDLEDWIFSAAMRWDELTK